MKLRQAWEYNFQPGTRTKPPTFNGALRRRIWDPSVGLMFDDTGQLVIVAREKLDPLRSGFALPWGATVEDMLADDWEREP